MDLPASYVEAHRYDGAAVQHDGRPETIPCAVQPRDVQILRDIWRYKFLTAPQVGELWWPGCSERAGQRRMRKLFEAGYVERFRPITRRGSFPWTYHLGREGHRLLRRVDVIPPRERFTERGIYDYGFVLHELQLNAWVLAYRRVLGDALLAWGGETHIEPPPSARRKSQLRLGGDWSAEGLRDPRPRLIRPDAVLEIRRDNGQEETRLFLIEYDRTRRPDKNYEKFRRYDAFLTGWWQESSYADRREPPFVIFVCQDREQRDQFVLAADREYTGHHWHPGAAHTQHEYPGRRRSLFAVELDAHAGVLEALRMPTYPLRHPLRVEEARLVRLPGRQCHE